MYKGLERRRSERRVYSGSPVRRTPQYTDFQSTQESDQFAKEHGFDPFKPLCTIRGDAVILLTTNGPFPNVLVGFVRKPEARDKWEEGVLHRWNIDGKSYDGHKTKIMDLVPNHFEGVDLDRPYRTRAGCPARVLTRDRLGERKLAGLVERTPGRETNQLWYPNGRANCASISPNDLVNYED